MQPAAQYDYRLFYADVLYVVAGAPVWALVTAVTAYLVALTTRALGLSRRQALWAMALYGLGSPALAASRGDWPQPLVAICWAASTYACLRYLSGGGRRWLWVSGIAVAYAVLTRPLEGSMTLLGPLLLLGWRMPRGWVPVASQLGAWVAGTLLTLATNWARYGSPTSSGYELGTAQASWTTPIWLGVPNDLLSPGRGLLWEFPATVIAVWGVRALWARGQKVEATVLAGLPAVLFIEAATFTDWVGGWDWGLRFLQPALPLLAVLAAAGIPALPAALRSWLPAGALAWGLLWNVPAVTTDILAGYGPAYADGAANWRLDAFPPIGAWRFLQHVFPSHGIDSSAVDIVWFRATLVAGKVALIPFVLLLAAAAWLWRRALALDERGVDRQAV